MNANPYAATATPLFLSAREDFSPGETALHRTQIFSIRARAGQTIRVLDGVLWVTEEDDADDHLLGAGETYVAAGRGRIVVESLAPASRFVFDQARA